MLVKILKPFHHTPEGSSASVLLRPSEDPNHREEVTDELCAGLSGEGYIDGKPHGLPLLSPKRREEMIERILAAGRAEMAKVPDADLIAAVARYEARAKELADDEQAEPQAEASAAIEAGGAIEAVEEPAAVETVAEPAEVIEVVVGKEGEGGAGPAPKAKKARKPAAKA